MSHVHMYMHVGPVSSDHRVALTLFSPSHVDVALHSRHVIQTDPRLSPPVATTSHTHRCVLMHDRRRVQAALATCRHAAHERGRASRLNSCPRAATLHRPCAGCSAHNSHPLPPASSPCPPSPRSQAVAHLLDAGDNVVDLREGVDLQVGGVRHRDVCAGDPLDGRVEVVERLRLVDARAELGSDAAGGPPLLDSHQPVRLLDGLDDGQAVKRADRAQVDDLGLDAHLCELLGGLEAGVHSARVRDESDV
mmetsp:Transcript_27413/g.82126  ORF Transcript_27413/g.82126 Transcript_27413/m.82126 type:complete len:250 (-) Transcript_27413:722-1471(-)